MIIGSIHIEISDNPDTCEPSLSMNVSLLIIAHVPTYSVSAQLFKGLLMKKMNPNN